MPDASELEAAIAAVTRPGCSHWADAQHLTVALLGSAVTANVFVVGMAVQAGALPLAAESVEQAIELNGVAVASNIEAFRWGRTMVARPEEVAAAAESARSPGSGLPHLDADTAARVGTLVAAFASGRDGSDGYEAWDLETAVRELCAYQSPRLAKQYLDFVETASSTDAESGDGSGRLTGACARGYFKLLAYKDEYEVARLMLDAAASEEARRLAAATGGRLAWKLHPPVLRALGLSGKITVPVTLAPLFRLLAAMRFVRGTVFDVFGYTRLRRAERSLPGEYRAALEADLRDLRAGGYDRALRRALLPETVRGYEHIKMAGIERLREEMPHT